MIAATAFLVGISSVGQTNNNFPIVYLVVGIIVIAICVYLYIKGKKEANFLPIIVQDFEKYFQWKSKKSKPIKNETLIANTRENFEQNDKTENNIIKWIDKKPWVKTILEVFNKYKIIEILTLLVFIFGFYLTIQQINLLNKQTDIQVKSLQLEYEPIITIAGFDAQRIDQNDSQSRYKIDILTKNSSRIPVYLDFYPNNDKVKLFSNNLLVGSNSVKVLHFETISDVSNRMDISFSLNISDFNKQKTNCFYFKGFCDFFKVPPLCITETFYQIVCCENGTQAINRQCAK